MLYQLSYDRHNNSSLHNISKLSAPMLEPNSVRTKPWDRFGTVDILFQ